MKVYVQVPVTGREWKEALREADALSEKVTAAGHEAVNPLRLMDNGQSGAPETIAPSASETARAMGRSVEALLGCDALLLHPAASDTGEDPKEIRYSKGCRTEALAAITYGLRVLTLSEEGRLEEDTGRYERFRVVSKSLALAADGFLCIADSGGYTSSCVYGTTLSIASAIANEMRSNKHIRMLLKLAQSVREFVSNEANLDGANGANE